MDSSRMHERASTATRIRDIIAKHCSIEDILSELHGSTEKTGGTFDFCECVNDVFVIWPKTDPAFKCYQFLNEIFTNNAVDFRIEMTPEERRKSSVIVALLKAVVQDRKRLTVQQLLNSISSSPKYPLELWWIFHTEGILTVNDLLSANASKPNVLKSIGRNIINLLMIDEKDGTHLKHVVTGVASFLVSCTFGRNNIEAIGATYSVAVQKVCKIILETSLKKMSSWLVDKEAFSRKIDVIGLLLECPLIERTTIHKLCHHALVILISYNPCCKASHAVSEQDKWTVKTINPNFLMLGRRIMMVLGKDNVITCFRQTLQHQEINWQGLLSLASIFVVCINGAPAALQTLVTDLLKEAFDDLNMESMLSAILLVRQASLEGVTQFSYSDWFERSFSNPNTTYANNPRTFIFLVKFLTNLVQHETAQFLKVHILRPPYVPQRCKDLYYDYTSLAKTRLADLNEALTDSFQNKPIYLHQIDESPNAAPSVEHDVRKAVDLLEKLGKIPSSLLHASIFRKTYYVGHFLPALLRPRVSEKQTKLIDELNQLGKIPPTMYARYLEECSKKDDEMESLSQPQANYDVQPIVCDDIDPLEDLFNCFKRFSTLLLEEAHLKILKETICDLSQKLRNVISLLSLQDSAAAVDIPAECLKTSTVSDEYCNIISHLLEIFVSCYSVDLHLSEQNDFNWASMLISIIFSQKSLVFPLYNILYNKLVCKADNLDDQEKKGCILCLVNIELLDENPILIICSDNSKVSLSYLIFTDLEIMSAPQMISFMKTACYCLNFLLSAMDSRLLQCSFLREIALFQKSIAKKFNFAARVLFPSLFGGPTWLRECPDENLKELVSQVLPLSITKTRIAKWELSLQDFLHFELQSQVYVECYAWHIDHLRWFVNSHFLTGLKKMKIKDFCSVIFQTLVSNTKECVSTVYILTLLQEHIHSLDENPSDSPWLQQELERLLPTGDLNKFHVIHLESKLSSFFRVAQSLPPFLFFSNKRMQKFSTQTFSLPIKLVNSQIREFLMDGCFFSASLVAYFLQGLMASTDLSQESEQATRKFLMECPQITVALLVHYKDLMSHLDFSSSPVLMTYMESIQEIVSLTEDASNAKQKTYCNWLLGLALSRKLWSCTTVTSMFSAFHARNADVIKYLFLFWISDRASRIILSKEEFSEVDEGIFQIMCQHSSLPVIADSFQPHAYQNTFVEKLIPTSILNMYPSACVWIILQFYERIRGSSSVNIRSIWLDLLLDNTIELSQFHDSAIVSGLSSVDVRVFPDIQFVVDSTTAVRNILSSEHHEVLRSVRQDKVKKIEISFQAVI